MCEVRIQDPYPVRHRNFDDVDVVVAGVAAAFVVQENGSLY